MSIKLCCKLAVTFCLDKEQNVLICTDLSCSVHTDNPQWPQRNDTGGKKLTQQVNKRLKHSDTIKRV